MIKYKGNKGGNSMNRKILLILVNIFHTLCIGFMCLTILFIMIELNHFGYASSHFSFTLLSLFLFSITLYFISKYFHDKLYRCPNCGENLYVRTNNTLGLSKKCANYCPNCGKKIDPKKY